MISLNGKENEMKKYDFFFLAGNIYLAAALAGTRGAWLVGVFFGVMMLYYMVKGE